MEAESTHGWPACGAAQEPRNLSAHPPAPTAPRAFLGLRALGLSASLPPGQGRGVVAGGAA